NIFEKSPKLTPIKGNPAIESLPMAIPVTPAMVFQHRWAELSGILLGSVIVSAVCAVGWSLFTGGGDFSKMWPLFCLIVAVSWSVLIPSKLWPPGKDDDSWTRRLILMTLGLGVALLAVWLDGYELPMPWTARPLDVLRPWQGDAEARQALR